MPLTDRIRLSFMMFLNYVILGAWYTTISTYLMNPKTLNFTGTEAGAVFGTAALACMISPFFVGMIADRLGEDGFFDFMRIVYAKYQYRILRVADFQRELEAYTGRSWQTFFDEWLYGKGMTDWSVDKVQLEEWSGSSGQWQARSSGQERAQGWL